MENRSNPKTEFLLIILFFVGAIVASVVAVGRGPDGRAHQSVMTTFWQLHVDQASLQRDMLQIRAGLLANYDPLVGSVVNLHRDVETLERLVATANLDLAGSLRAQFSELRTNIDAEERYVEEFKTRNALLVNSSRIFVHLMAPAPAAGSTIDEPGRVGLDGLASLMMRFTEEPKADRAASLKLKFVALLRADDDRSHALSRHGQMILMARPLVDASLAGVQKSSVPQLIQRIEQTYVDAYVRADRFANLAKIVLALIAFTLCGLVAVLLARLRGRSQRLAEQLAFETAAGFARVGLANAEPDAFDEALRAALATFSAFFKARVALQIMDRDEDGSGEIYTHGEDGCNAGVAAWQDNIQFLRQAGSDDTGSPGFLVVDEGVAGHGQIVITAAMPGDMAMIAGCILTYPHAAPRLTKRLKAQMHTAMDVMTDAIRLNWMRRDRTVLEQRLEHAKRLEAIGTLAGGIAHEFNNYIGALLGYGEMLRQSMRRRSRSYAYAAEIVGICHRAMVTVEQILSFSRRRDRDRRPFDLRQQVEDVIGNLRVSLSAHFDLDLCVQGDRFVIRGHPVEVKQIVTNLCRNAFEAMPPDRRCAVKLERYDTCVAESLSHGELAPGSYASLSVQDRGPGIPSNLLTHLFEPFFTTKGHLGGTGLGLSVVHGSAAALSAPINVKSSAGHGTRFNVFFPLVDDSPVPLDAFFPESVIPLGHGELIAIVYADEERRTELEDCIASFGYEPIGFSGIAEALDRFRELDPPQLLLVDHASGPSEESGCISASLANVPVMFIGDDNADHTTGVDLVLWPLDPRRLMRTIRKKLGEMSVDGTVPSQMDRL